MSEHSGGTGARVARVFTLLGEVETGNRPMRPRNLMDLSSLVPSGGEQ